MALKQGFTALCIYKLGVSNAHQQRPPALALLLMTTRPTKCCQALLRLYSDALQQRRLGHRALAAVNCKQGRVMQYTEQAGCTLLGGTGA